MSPEQASELIQLVTELNNKVNLLSSINLILGLILMFLVAKLGVDLYGGN